MEGKMKNRYIMFRTEENADRRSVPELTLDQILWEPDCGIRAGGSICYDDRNLYVHLYAKEKDIRAEYILPPAPVHEDSCLEFFMMPEGEDRYLNFEINPNGCLHLGFGPNRQERENALPQDPKEAFRIRTARTLEGWEADYRIPVQFLRRFYPAFECSGKLYANVYKCGDKTVHPHYLAWNPVASAVPDYHRPECFGEMLFG